MVYTDIHFNHKLYSQLPLVRLTRSNVGSTGSATLVYRRPFFFTQPEYSGDISTFPVISVTLKSNNGTIESKHINYEFYEGQPVVIKVIFLFTTREEWLNFLKFFTLYTKERLFLFEKFYDSIK